MPFYEYECPHCGYQDEVLQKISDKPLKKCPSCGKDGLKKLMSAPVFRLKGSGWYETDFKSDKENKRNLHGAEKETPSGDTAKGDTPKGDTAKPDTAKPQTSDQGKPAADKPAASSAKPGARAKVKHKSARSAKRPARW